MTYLLISTYHFLTSTLQETPNFSVEVATGDDDVGVRLSTDGFDANFPNGQILGVNITGNSFNNYFKGVLFTNVEYRNCLVSGNVFTAKEFTEARFNSAVISGATQANPVVITATAHGYNDGDTVTINDVVGMTELNGNTYTVANKNVNDFELSGIDGTAFTAYGSVGTASTEMNTYAPLAQADSNARLQNCAFFNNIVYGATYLYATATGGGGAGTVPTPRGFCGNTLQFIKNIKTADIAISSIETNFTNNTGKAFLDRDYGEHDIQNSLSDASLSGSSARKYCFRFVTGSTVRFHIDDAGGVRSF